MDSGQTQADLDKILATPEPCQECADTESENPQLRAPLSDICFINKCQIHKMLKLQSLIN
jgi:hypothetical protein